MHLPLLHLFRKRTPGFRWFILAVLAVPFLWGCQGGSKPETPDIQRPILKGIKTATIAPMVVDDLYETTGTVKADRISTVASRIMGSVTALHVREGDQVQAGQRLLVIDSQDLVQREKGAAMAFESAKEHRALAEATWRRYRNLYIEKALSQQEMDEVDTRKKIAENEYERARAAVDEAKTSRAFAVIKAPFAGTIISRTVTEGSMAVPGQPLLTIENTASLYAEVFIDEGLLGRLKKGLPVTIDISGRSIRGTIRDIVTAVDPRSRTFLAKISLPADGLKSGLFVKVHIPTGKKEILLVPAAATVRKGQLTGVYAVAADGVVTFRLIKAGRSYPDGRVEVLSGLFPNERIISEGVGKAVDGGMIQDTPKQ